MQEKIKFKNRKPFSFPYPLHSLGKNDKGYDRWESLGGLLPAGTKLKAGKKAKFIFTLGLIEVVKKPGNWKKLGSHFPRHYEGKKDHYEWYHIGNELLYMVDVFFPGKINKENKESVVYFLLEEGYFYIMNTERSSILDDFKELLI